MSEKSKLIPVTTIQCIIGNESGTSLLLIEEESGWALPNLQWEGNDWFPYYGEQIKASAKKKFNIDATMLRHIHKLRRNQGHIYELEIQDANWPLPERGRWIDKTQLPALTLAIESQLPFMEAWFAEVGIPELPPYAHPGNNVVGWTKRLMEAFWLVCRLNELYMALRCYHEIAHLEPARPGHEIAYSGPSYHLRNMLNQDSSK